MTPDAAAPPWWDLDRSLRSRLVAVAMLATAVAVSGVIGVSYVAVRHELRGQLDKQLKRQAVLLETPAILGRGDPALDVAVQTGFGEVGGYYQLVRTDGVVRKPPAQITLPATQVDTQIAAGTRGDTIRDVRIARRHVRMFTTRVGTVWALQVAIPATTVDLQLRRLAVAFLVVAASGLVLAAMLVVGAYRKALAPVGDLTDAAERIAATRDLTLRIDASRPDELGRLAASFNTMLQALETSVGAQRQLVADASHELRTPLASLRTNVEVLNQVAEMPEDVRREVLTGIVGQVEELTGLVADVVELARGDEPVQEQDDVAFDEVVENAVDRARRHWPHVTFEVATEPVTVRGVARRLDRAVANLLDNAAKFSTAPATVEVRLTHDGTLTVRDHGPGVPEDALPYVFDRFYRADEARALPGSGLGLAIVKQFAESHGGTVSLRNADGGGAVAELRLPQQPFR